MSGGTQPPTVGTRDLPLNPVEQPDSACEHEVSPASVSDLQPQLTEQQKVLKDKLGLDERVCASFDSGKEGVQTFLANLEKGEFDPGLFRRFLLRLSSLFGGPEYEVAVKQFRVEMATAKGQELFRQEDFLNDLAAAIKSCDSKELPRALPVVHDLLAADPAARRDFFIQKLLISCLEEAYEETTKDEINVKNFTEKYKGYLAINQFCVDSKMQYEEGEQTQINSKCKEIEKQVDTKVALLISNTMYCAITAISEDEKNQHIQRLSGIRQCLLPLQNYFYSLENMAMQCGYFDQISNNFTSILECFGDDHNEQIENFKALVEGLKKISREVLTEEATHRESDETYDRGKNWKQKAGKFFEKNQKLMWAALKMSKTNGSFVDTLFRAFIVYVGNTDDLSTTFSSAARRTMEKAMGGEPSDFSNLLPEQVRLLCEGANLPELLRNDRTAEENKEAIDMVLKFIQKALARTDLQISFEDIMSENISQKTCQRLLAFVEGESRNYDPRLVDFIRNGVAQRTAH
jgi:hypothetical protein